MKTWFRCIAPAKESDQLIVDVLDEIGAWGVGAAQFVQAVKDAKPSAVHLRINSPGGSVFDGLAVYNFLRGLAVPVTAEVLGICASMASVVMCAASKVRCPANAFVMVHNPVGGLAFGADSDEMRKTADLLDQMGASIARIYAAKCGKTPEEVKTAMDAETWMDGEQARAWGLVDELTDAADLAAVAPFAGRFGGAPEKVKALLEVPPADPAPVVAPDPVPPSMEALLNAQVGNELSASYRYAMLAALFAARGLDGFAQRFEGQASDEIEHAQRVYRYLVDTGTTLILPAIPAPVFADVADVAGMTLAALDQEKAVTADWAKIGEMAKAQNNGATTKLAQDFAEMQVAEEKEAVTLHQRVTLASSGDGLLLIDADLKGVFAKAQADAAAQARAALVAEVRPEVETAVRAELKAATPPPADPREEFKAMVALFGEERAARYFGKSLDLASAKDAFIAEAKAEVGKLRADKTDLETRLAETRGHPSLPFVPTDGKPVGRLRIGEDEFEAYCKANGITGAKKDQLRAAMSTSDGPQS